jgi:hypothetical protein
MRGRESMALDVNDAFPLAMLFHASHPDDVHMALVLVDLVVNSGRTIVDFVQAIRNLNVTICVAIAASIVQRRIFYDKLRRQVQCK